MDWEIQAALSGLAELGLPISDANCRRWWKAVDIEVNRLSPLGHSSIVEACGSLVSSDSRDLDWRVSVSADGKICWCGCEDKQRHEAMASRFHDDAGKHFCKHAMALLMRIKGGDTECQAQGLNGKSLKCWLLGSKKLIASIDALLSPEDLRQLKEMV